MPSFLGNVLNFSNDIPFAILCRAVRTARRMSAVENVSRQCRRQCRLVMSARGQQAERRRDGLLGLSGQIHRQRATDSPPARPAAPPRDLTVVAGPRGIGGRVGPSLPTFRQRLLSSIPVKLFPASSGPRSDFITWTTLKIHD